MEPRNPRVLFYCHDSYGLGHLRRTLTIARALSERVQGATMMCVTGSPVPEIFRLPPRLDIVKVPSVTKDDEGRYVSGRLPLPLMEVVRTRSALLQATVESYRPDVVVIDHSPLGVGGELLPTLEHLRKRRGVRVVLGLRDVLDDPQRARSQLQRSDVLHCLRELYDDILVYGHRSILDLESEYGLPAAIGRKLQYVGVVCSTTAAGPHESSPPEPIAAPNLLVNAGGGADGYSLLRATVEALGQAPSTFRFSATLISGPLMDRRHYMSLVHAVAGDPRFSIHARTSHMDVLMGDADLILAMGGYNSVYEALSLGRRLLVHPRSAPRREQLERAQRLDRLGVLGVIQPRELTSPSTLRERITAALQTPAVDSRAAGLSFRGACRAAERILELRACTETNRN